MKGPDYVVSSIHEETACDECGGPIYVGEGVWYWGDHDMAFCCLDCETVYIARDTEQVRNGARVVFATGGSW